MALASKVMQGGFSAGQASAMVGGINATVSAAGTTQGTATVVSAGVVNVSTVGASAGIILPACSPGDEQIIYNSGANTLTIYPDLSSKINNLAVNVGIFLPIQTGIQLTRVTSTLWIGILSA